jgi:hypothetical protein
MTMALQLIPIQKAKVSDQRLQQLSSLQGEIRCAQFVAARAAEEQSAQLKRLMDQSKVDASKTQEMLTQVSCLQFVCLCVHCHNQAEYEFALSCLMCVGVMCCRGAECAAEAADGPVESGRQQDTGDAHAGELTLVHKKG